MAISNREDFLDRIAQKLGRERRTSGVTRPKWKHQPQVNVFKGYSQDDLVEVLKNHCDAIHTQYIGTTKEKLTHVIADIFSQLEAKSVIAPGDSRFKEYGLDSFFLAEQEKKKLEYYVWDPDKGEENIKQAEKADVGITFSDMTLAESATVTLFSESSKGRSVSLLPTVYIAVIPKSTIVPRLTQAMEEIHQRVKRGEVLPSCINFISGPSNSADIEMNLVVGVHGPIKATYIVVDDI
jgi:L-lactate dehydrogenase complex protein LldG